MTLEQKISALFDSLDALVRNIADLVRHHPDTQQDVLAIITRHQARLSKIVDRKLA